MLVDLWTAEADVDTLMDFIRLKLNTDKTQIIRVGSRQASSWLMG